VAYGKDFLGPNEAGYGLNLFPPDVAPPPEPFEQPVDISRAMPWRDTVRRGLTVTFSHGLAAGLEISRDVEHGQGEGVATATEAAWGLLQPTESNQGTSWRQTDPLEHSHDMPWRSLLPVEIARDLLYRQTDPRSAEVEARWRLAEAMEIARSADWGNGNARDVLRSSPWILGTMVYPDWDIPWGYGRAPRTLVDSPNIDLPVPDVPGPPPVYVPPAGDQVDLPLECRWRDIPGDQLALPLRKYQCLRSSYVVDNDLILKRASDDAEVACLQLDISGDLDSYTNAWSAQVHVTDFEQLVDPTDTGPVEVVATINGEDHLLLLERFSRDAVFDDVRGKVATVRVQGRSVSAELDEPYSARKSRFEAQAKSHWQLMQQELPLGTDWTLEAHPAWSDYGDNITQTVPANTFSYTDLSPIQAIARIAEATGAVVQQVPAERKLKIVPRYVAKPWEWANTTADLEIDAGQLRSSGLEFEPAVLHNGVYVSGETNGVLVECRRDGTAGAPWLDMIVDQLITDPQHALQRGIKELGSTGKRQVYALELPVDSNEDGLIQTGQILNVVESVTVDWNGQTIAWSESGTWSEGRGLEIWQRIAVERYRDE
jgi:hypothetical protein